MSYQLKWEGSKEFNWESHSNIFHRNVILITSALSLAEF